MLQIKNVCKSFNKVEVLSDISTEIKKGEVYGLIGANGAGKTTLMNIIAGVLKADKGQILIDGQDASTIKNMRVGYILDIPSMWEFFNAYEYFEYLASCTKMTKAEIKQKSDAVLETVGLSDVGTKLIKSYSRGMKQRFGIAAVLFNDPDIILMDEPTSALDPKGRFEVLSIIKKLKNQGKTVMLSTHILNDIEKVCDKIGLLINHKLKIEGDISQVMSKYSSSVFELVAAEGYTDKLYEFLDTMPIAENLQREGAVIRVTMPEGNDGKTALVKLLAKSMLPLNSISVKTATLEEIFLMEA